MNSPIGRALLFMALAPLLMIAAATPAAADVVVRGNVQIFNPITSAYEPLKQARVRVVLWEYTDPDTLDVETSTDNSGNYRITKGNAWFRSGYDAYVMVFAESNNKLEIQSTYPQIDGYQALTSQFFARDDNTTTRDIRIGGGSANVSRYQVGGVNGVFASAAGRQTSERAFFLYNEMTDHRLRLMNLSLSSGDFEEKETAYPAGDWGVYIGFFDFIRYPDLHFSESGGFRRAAEVARHELSHGVMADAYYLWPGWTHFLTGESPGSHSLWTVATRHEWAWTEAWAEFLAEATQRPRYGANIDLESVDAAWRSRVSPASADRSRVEGEIAASLWDIHDGIGWEKRLEQDSAIPGDEMFFDGISDASLSKIWHIFKTYRPYTFTHGSDPNDSFLYYWLNRTSFGQRHELKAILYNRGIRVPQFPQSRPTLSLGTVTWSGNTAQIPITVTENDDIDRTSCWVDVFVNGSKVQSTRLTTGWSGNRCSQTLNQPIAWRAGDPNPALLVAVHDNMQSSSAGQTLAPPATAALSGIAVEIQAVRLRHLNSSSIFNLIPIPDLQNAALSVTVTDGRTSRTTRIPPSGAWSVRSGSEFTYSTPTAAFQTNDPGAFVQLSLEVSGSLGSAPVRATRAQRWTREQNYGMGARTETFEMQSAVPVPGFRGVQVEVAYRIYPARSLLIRPETLKLLSPQLRLQAIPRAVPPADAKPSPQKLLAQANRLTDEYARLQAQAMEMASELEYRLTPGKMEELAKQNPGGARALPQGAPGLKIPVKPETFRPEAGGFTEPPELPFLDKAAQGLLLPARLPSQARGTLSALNAYAASRASRLDALRAEAEQLSSRLAEAAKEVQESEKTRPAGARAARSAQVVEGPAALADAGRRLAAILSGDPHVKTTLQKVQSAVQKALPAVQ